MFFSLTVTNVVDIDFSLYPGLLNIKIRVIIPQHGPVCLFYPRLPSYQMACFITIKGKSAFTTIDALDIKRHIFITAMINSATTTITVIDE